MAGLRVRDLGTLRLTGCALGLQGTGTHDEMALDERTKLANEGLVVAAVDVVRLGQSRMRGRVRITSRALWIDQGRLLEQLHKVRSDPLALQSTSLSEGGRWTGRLGLTGGQSSHDVKAVQGI